jgi:uncharacterized membrane protein
MANNRLPIMALGIGAIAGLRSLTAPALVSRAACGKSLKLRNNGLNFLKSKRTATIFAVAGAGELIADKLPFIPNRTAPGPLAVRIASGALCAAAIYSAHRKSVVRGAILGGLGALGGTFGGYQARRLIRTRLHVPDPVIAVAEDALAIGAGTRIASAQ